MTDTPDQPSPSDDAPTGLRKSLTSYGDNGFSLFLRKAFIKGAGYTDSALDRPVIGIVDTGSAYNPCHGNSPQLIEAVKRGVMLAGGLPMEFPTISIAESFSQPTSMYLRNLMSMDTEEMLRAQPMDAVVLIGGCDKTVPAQLMGAASAGIPAIQLITGSMLTGSHRSERVGACTDCRRYWARFRAEEIDEAEIAAVNDQLVASVGTCSVMGTASTMACIAEALGMTVPGGASPPAVTAQRMRIAELTGKEAVQMARDGLTIDKILTAEAFENAMRVLLAIGGSTNGIVHLTAIAGRMGFDVDLKALDRMGRETPVLLDLKPSGQHYMEDFDKAGGMATLLRELKPLLHLDALTVTGRTLGEEIDAAGPAFAQKVGDHQAVGRRCAPDGARRPRGRVRERGGRRRAHRLRRPRRERRRHPRAQEHRSERRARHARSGLHPDSEEARDGRRQGHGAHLRWPHERHGIRDHRAARDARVRDRRAARACAKR
jgi:dihydroxy-acid dehydratase